MGTRDEYVKTVKTAAVSLGTKGVMSLLVAEVPVFANPILKFIAEQIVEEMITKLVDATEFGAFFLYIDFRVNKQGREFYDAAIANVKVKLGGTPEQKKRAEEELIRKFNALVVLSA